eukprot:gene3088-3367_t
MVNALSKPEQLGAVNGVGQTLASLARGLGPAVAGVLWGATVEGLKVQGAQMVPYLMVALTAILGLVIYCCLRPFEGVEVVEGDLYPAATITATPDAAVDALAGAASVKPAATCDAWQLNWPANSPYCWYKRDSDGNPQGPNSNVFDDTNVLVNQAGQLVLQVTRTATTPTTTYTSGEVFLDRSLGFGDYIFVVQTPASAIHHKLVASPFIYADDNREFDIEYARVRVVQSAEQKPVDSRCGCSSMRALAK